MPVGKRGLTTIWLLLVVALLVLSGSIGLLYTSYARQSHASTATIAQPTASLSARASVQAQSSNPYVSGTSKLLMNDPLNRPSATWQVDEHDNLGGSCTFTNNTYRVGETQKGYFRICNAQSTDVSDFVFEVRMQIISGHCGGILFRQLKAGQYYLYRVCSDGYYGLTRFVDNTGQNSHSMGSSISTSIHQGNKENVIAVVAQGPRIHLYINNSKIGDFNDVNYLHGALGLIADYKDAPVNVAYSDLRVWNLIA